MNIECTYCKKARHTREKCFCLIRYQPNPNYKGRKPQVVNYVVTDSGTPHVGFMNSNIGASPARTGSGVSSKSYMEDFSQLKTEVECLRILVHSLEVAVAAKSVTAYI